MPYSKSKEKRLARKVHWPDLRYGPNGEQRLFYSADEVPLGWSDKKYIPYINKPIILLNRDELVAELTKRNIRIDPTWGTAHMKRLIDSDTSTAR
jgi:hypothetical protein